MAYTDFVIKWDEDPTVMTKRVLKSIILNRLKIHKPSVCFICGDSGEGKSWAALKIQELLLEMDGIKLIDYLREINVFTPLEYPEKLDPLLHSRELSKIRIICMHEAREVIKAKLWQSFLTQAVSDVNAMSRAIKPLCIMIISQFIRDITADMRYTLTYYFKAERPAGGNHRTRLRLYKMWKDDRDLEKPKLKKRRISGYIVMPNGKRRRWSPRYLEVTSPSREVTKLFKELDTSGKSDILKRKLNKLIDTIREDLDLEENKINSMVDYYSRHRDQLHLIGKFKSGSIKLNKDVKELHKLKPKEVKEFQEKLNVRIKTILEVERKENIEKQKQIIKEVQDGGTIKRR